MTVTVKNHVEENPGAAIIVFAAFSLVVGAWYLIKNRRKIFKKIRRWWRRLTGRKDFWGYVLAGVLFFGFSAFILFLDFRY